MYYMWNETFENLEKNFRRNDGEIKNIQNFKFNIDDKQAAAKFRIEQLDFLTSLYKDEKAFIEELSKDKYQGFYIENKQNEKPITITISNKKSFRIKEIPVIYNDKFITKIASEIRIKKAKRDKIKKEQHKKGKSDDIVLDSTSHLTEFVGYVKTLATNKVSRKYLINPREALKEIPVEDRYTLNDPINGDVELNNGTLKKGIRNILNEYIGYKIVYEERKSFGQSTLEIDENLNAINDELLMHFRRNYHNIREVVVWESAFKKILKKQLQDKNCQNKDELESCLNYVNFQKDYRNDKIDKGEWEYYQYEFLNGKVEPINTQKESVNNEKMLELYNEGGIAAIWEGMDADEIYKSENDAKNLGVIKKR